MWIFTPESFVSVVAHREKPDFLLVRARLQGDLETLFPGCAVQTTPNADYLFRAEIPREVVAEIIRHQLQGLAYPNVKNAIPSETDTDDLRHRAMNRVWAVMHEAQTENAQPRSRRGRRLTHPDML